MLHGDRVTDPVIAAVVPELHNDALPIALVAGVLLEVYIVDDLPRTATVLHGPIGRDGAEGLASNVAIKGIGTLILGLWRTTMA